MMSWLLSFDSPVVFRRPILKVPRIDTLFNSVGLAGAAGLDSIADDDDIVPL